MKITESKLREIISDVINESEDVREYIKKTRIKNMIQGFQVDSHNLRITIEGLLKFENELDPQFVSYMKDIYEVL